MHMNKKAMLAKLIEIESSIKELREMMQKDLVNEKIVSSEDASEGRSTPGKAL